MRNLYDVVGEYAGWQLGQQKLTQWAAVERRVLEQDA